MSTISKLLSRVEPWTVKSWCGQKVLPDLAKSCQKVLPDLAKIHQKVLPDWCKKCQNCTGGPIKKCYFKDLSQIVQGQQWAKKIGQKVLKNAKKSQNMFHLISTVSKLLSEVEPWTVKSWCGQKVLPDLAKSCQKVLPDWAKSCQNRIAGQIKKCFSKDLWQNVQGWKGPKYVFPF